MKKQDNKVALITGGAVRIGSVIASTLAQAGYNLAIHYASSHKLAITLKKQLTKKYPIRIETFQENFSKKLIDSESKSLINQVFTTFGNLDLLVNNAAVFEYDNPSSFTVQKLEKHLAINLAVPIFLGQNFYQKIITKAHKNKPDYCIINILDHKLFALNPDYFSYTLAKSALFNATKMQAIQFAPHIRVCGVAPGLTLPSKLMDEQIFTHGKKVSLTGDSGNPEDIAQGVLFLGQNRSITGEIIRIDGGQSYMRLTRDVYYEK